MTEASPQTPDLEEAIAKLIAAIQNPQRGAVGEALADLIGVIDHLSGSQFAAAAASLVGGLDLSAAANAPTPAQASSAAPGEGLGVEIDHLAQTVAARAHEDPKSSYTASLLSAGVEKCAKKLGEEAVETALAAAKGDKKAIAAEAADLMYHLIVLLQAAGVSGDAVAATLRARRGISGLDEKASRGGQ